MRVPVSLAIGLAALVAAAPVGAFETFIPLGTGYSTDTATLPEFDSPQDRINLETDILETEIYYRGRNAAERDSYLRRFAGQSENGGGDYSIDY